MRFKLFIYEGNTSKLKFVYHGPKHSTDLYMKAILEGNFNQLAASFFVEQLRNSRNIHTGDRFVLGVKLHKSTHTYRVISEGIVGKDWKL